MGELRLGHIEARFDVPAWLARTLSQCKRALLRGRGPKNKAAELRFQDLVLRGDFPSALRWRFRTYVVANRWLLREVEVAGARLAHGSISQDERVASLFLPVSKADVGGHGVERKLRCFCRGSDRDSTCPVHTLLSQIEDVARASGITPSSEAAWSQPLFPTVDNSVPTKSAMVAGWQRLAPAGVTEGGHSARRSGAKRCAHEGWHITAIQHLGRWASTQVLEYVEEAYAEVPGTGQAFGASPLQSEVDWAPLPALHDRLKAVEEQQALISEKMSNGAKQSVRTEPHLTVGCQDIGQEELFVLATTGPANRRKLHVRASVHWTAPSHAWSTRCGWYFSAQGFRLLRRSQVEEAPYDSCKHCWKLEEGQLAALPEEDRWQAPEQSCLE